MKETIIDNRFATLWYHPESGIVHHYFKKYTYGDAFRQVLTKGLETMEANGSRKWLSDDRENNALTKEDSDWALSTWAPRVIELGWAFWAIVLPRKVIGQMNMKRWAETYAEKGVTVQAFDDPADALSWLESC